MRRSFHVPLRTAQPTLEVAERRPYHEVIMMGHRGLTGGDEFEAFEKGFRRYLRWGRGTIAKMKRAYSKRARKAVRMNLRAECKRTDHE